MKQILCTLAAIACVFTATAQTKVVAHRGYHAKKGSAENTVSSLRNAQKLGVYGVEFDVNLTADDSLIVFHGPWLEDKAGKERLHVQKSNYRDIAVHRVQNGQPIPTLREFLRQGQQDENTRLILEIKKHATPNGKRKPSRQSSHSCAKRAWPDTPNTCRSASMSAAN